MRLHKGPVYIAPVLEEQRVPNLVMKSRTPESSDLRNAGVHLCSLLSARTRSSLCLIQGKGWPKWVEFLALRQHQLPDTRLLLPALNDLPCAPAPSTCSLPGCRARGTPGAMGMLGSGGQQPLGTPWPGCIFSLWSWEKESVFINLHSQE